MDFLRFVLGSVYYVGMFLAILFLDGRRLLAGGAISGAVLAPIIFGGRQPFVVDVLVGGGLGLCLSGLGYIAKEKLQPYLRPHLDPEAWIAETEKSAGPPAGSPEERSVRLILANSAAAGASAAGLLLVGIADIVRQGLHFKQLFEQLSIWLVTIMVVAWIGVSLFDLTSGTSRNPSVTQRGTWVKVGLLTFLIAMFQEIIGNLMEKGLQLKDGVGICILFMNSLTAGVVTYYWTACAQLRQRSIAWRAAFCSSLLGGLMFFPPVAVLTLKVVPYWGSGFDGQKTQFLVLVTIFLAAAIVCFMGSCSSG